jgi:hypothetical protein
MGSVDRGGEHRQVSCGSGHGEDGGAQGGQRRPWAHAREGAEGFVGGSRGVILTAVRRCLGQRARTG